MPIQKILMDNGSIIDAKDYLTPENYQNQRLSEYMSFSEVDCEGAVIIAAVLIDAFRAIRARWGKPIIINSGYRTAEYQRRLRERYEAEGKKGLAAEKSPHTEGMALDLNCRDKAEVEGLVATIRQVNAEIGGFLRIGWKLYLGSGMHFVHIDVCPYFYGEGGAFAKRQVSPAWRQPGGEW